MGPDLDGMEPDLRGMGWDGWDMGSSFMEWDGTQATYIRKVTKIGIDFSSWIRISRPAPSHASPTVSLI
jgi:hypothetical protein